MRIATILLGLLIGGCIVVQSTPISTELTPDESSKAADLRHYFDLVNIKAYDKKVNAVILWGKCEDGKWVGLCTFRSDGVHKIEIDSVYFGNSTTKNSMYLKGTIIHEMVHAYFGIGGHGPNFQQECDRVGKIMGIESKYIYNKELYKNDVRP